MEFSLSSSNQSNIILNSVNEASISDDIQNINI